MKKIFLSIVCLAISLTAFGQAKRPTIMVVPSDNWCVQNNYVQTFDNQGTQMVLPDYKRALQNDANLLLAISKINEMMMERGFPLEDLEATLRNLESDAAENAMLTSDTGSEIAESPIDILKRTAKADILMQLTYSINQVGPKKSLTFNLQGLDAYTGKQIAGASGTGSPSFTTELPVLIEEAVLSHIDNFNAQLQSHFDDMFTNGREIIVQIKVWGDADYDLEEEFDGEELGYIIEEWMADNTVQGRFNTTDATENMMLFKQVRIPLEYEENGKVRQMDARLWVGMLRKYLKSTYGVESKLMTRGLGQAQLVIGGK